MSWRRLMLKPVFCWVALFVSLFVSLLGAVPLGAAEWISQQRVSLPVITLRQLLAEGSGLQASDERGELHYTRVSAQVVSLDALSEQSQDWPVYVPDRWTAKAQIEVLDEQAFYGLLSAGAGRPVIYLHGYNESFHRSVRRALLLRQRLGLAGRLVLLSWPSDGNIINYTRDEADLYWSVPYIRRVLERLSAEYGAGGFELIAHSLGGRGLALALAQLHDQRPELGPVAAQVIFVAADMDATVFADRQAKIVANAQRVSLYTSKLDEPLALSATLHGYPRLGQSGMHTAVLDGIEVIDVTGVPRRRPSGHNYHLGSPVVQADLRAVLAGKSPQLRRLLRQKGAQHWMLAPVR